MCADAAPLCVADVGSIRVTYLPDGINHVRPGDFYPAATPTIWGVHADHIDEDGWLVMSIGSLLIESAERKILVDLAWGPGTTDFAELTGGERQGDVSGGELLHSLARAGLKPDDIDSVFYSHLHPDHVGWVCDEDGKPYFPNATHYLSTDEWEYWTQGPEADSWRAPSAAQFAVMEARLSLSSGDCTAAPGVDFMATPGHTPGHNSFVVSSGEERMIIFGDAVHCPVELARPEIDFVQDVDPALSRTTKEHIMRELEKPNTIGAGGHFPNLIFGRMLRGQGSGISMLAGQSRLS